MRPGLLGLVVEGCRARSCRDAASSATWCRRTSRRRAPTPLLGNLWWVLDPLLQMLVYVVLVSVIFARKPARLPLFIFAAILPWKWFTTSVSDGDHVGREPGPADQADPVPEDRPADAATVAGDRQLRVRDDPAAGCLLLLFRDRIDARTSSSSRSSPWSSSSSRWRSRSSSPRSTCSSATSATSPATSLRLWFYLSPGLYGIDQLQTSSTLKDHPQILGDAVSSTRSRPVHCLSRGDLRQRDRRTAPPGLGGAGRAPPASRWSSSPSRRWSSSASNPRSPRSCEARMTATAGRSATLPPDVAITPRASASGTACASPARRRCANRSRKLLSRQTASGVLGAPRRVVPARPRRVARRHRPERGRQEHAPPGAGRDHHAVGGHDRRPRPDLEPARPRGRVRPGADRPRQHPARWGVHGHRRPRR